MTEVPDEDFDLDLAFALDEALACLSEVQRAVVELRFINEVPQAEVARIRGTSRVAVLKAERRGLKALRDALARLGHYGPMGL